MIIYNKHSIQTKFIPEWFNDTIGVDDIKEAMSYVKDSEQTYVLIGFIYKEGQYDYFKGKNTYFITNVGNLPPVFKTVKEEERGLSYIHQLVALSLLPSDDNVMSLCTEHDNYFNFLSSNKQIQDFILNFDYTKLDELIEKCYYTNIGDLSIYLIYENDAKLKLPMAHRALENKEGLFIVISQTRSDNDILTIFAKSVNMVKLANKFEVDNPENSNILTMFIPSHINVLGNQLSKFIGGNNE